MVQPIISVKSNLTKRLIESTPVPDAGRVMLWDKQVRGLGVKIEASGHRAFIWYRSVRNYPRWKTVGSISDLSVDEARGIATGWNAALARWKAANYDGPDPLARPEALTLDKLVDEHVEKHLKHHAKRPDRAERYLRWTVEKYMPNWRERRVSEIRFEDVDALHRKIGAKGHHRTANRVVKLLRTLLNWGIRSRLWHGENPTKHINYYRENERDRYLLPEELAKFWTALRREKNPDVRDALALLLWTGVRKGDLFEARWQDFALDDNKWTIPNPKSRTPYAVPLTPEAVEIFRERWKRREFDSPWVFPSSGQSGHLIDIANAWKRLLVAAGLDYADGSRSRPTMHDLRRTAASYMVAQGTSMPVVAKFLGHSSAARVTEIYARLDLSPVRQALESSQKVMLAAMKTKPRPALEAAPKRAASRG